MEFRLMSNIIRSADHHINERLAVELYRNSNTAVRELAPFTGTFAIDSRPSLVSFNDQLDKFYEDCLLNRIENETVRYFYARKTTVNEFKNFEKSYQKKEESRVEQVDNNTSRSHPNKLYNFYKKSREQNWNKEELSKNRKKFNKKFSEYEKKSRKRVREERKHAAQFSEFLDHQLFHGSRITVEFIYNNRLSITEQLDDIFQNDWSFKNLMAKHRQLLRIYKKSINEVRRDIISDINKQLDSRKEIH